MRPEEHIDEKATSTSGNTKEAAPKDLSFEDQILRTLNKMIFEYATEAEELRFKSLLRGTSCIETMHRVFGADNPEIASCRAQYDVKNCLDCVPGMPGCFIAAHREELCEACEEHTLFDEDTDSCVCRYGEADPMRDVVDANWRKTTLIIAKQIVSSSGLDEIDWEQVRSEQDSCKGMMETMWDMLQSMRGDASHSPSA